MIEDDETTVAGSLVSGVGFQSNTGGSRVHSFSARGGTGVVPLEEDDVDEAALGRNVPEERSMGMVRGIMEMADRHNANQTLTVTITNHAGGTADANANPMCPR